MNIPNTLTILRVVLIPFFVIFMSVTDVDKYIALAIFIVASLTDMLDGYLARKIIRLQTLESSWTRWRTNCWCVRPLSA